MLARAPLLSLPRSKVLAVIGAVPHLSPFLQSLYECKYSGFFKASRPCRCACAACSDCAPGCDCAAGAVGSQAGARDRGALFRVLGWSIAERNSRRSALAQATHAPLAPSPGVCGADGPALVRHVPCAPPVLAQVGLPGPLTNTRTRPSCTAPQAFVGLMDLVRSDMYLAPHLRWYMREARLVAYSQFLESYKSVTLDSMAVAFDVGPHFLDQVCVLGGGERGHGLGVASPCGCKGSTPYGGGV